MENKNGMDISTLMIKKLLHRVQYFIKSQKIFCQFQKTLYICTTENGSTTVIRRDGRVVDCDSLENY